VSPGTRGGGTGHSRPGHRDPERRTFGVRDVIFILLTLVVFAVLGLVVRAVEKL
jgi:hypothetical protein